MRTINYLSNSNATSNDNEEHEGRGRKSRRRNSLTSSPCSPLQWREMKSNNFPLLSDDIHDVGISSNYSSVDLDDERRSNSRGRHKGRNSKRLVKVIKTLKCSVRADDDDHKFEYELEEARKINEAGPS